VVKDGLLEGESLSFATRNIYVWEIKGSERGVKGEWKGSGRGVEGTIGEC
jgi:hypothetical protein